MPCEHYQDALAAAAAGGASPQGELRSHLDACPSCRAAFDQEVYLFSAIDSGLNSVANQNVPPSLLPRVRAAITESPAPAPSWLPRYALAAVTSAVVLAFFIALRPHQPGPNIQAVQTPAVRQSLSPSASAGSSPAASTLTASARPRSALRRNSAVAYRVVASQPEVLVPAEEREGYALLVTSLRERFEISKALADAINDKQDSPNFSKPLEIAQLEVKPLETQDSSTPDRAEK
jgi:anti-sigma factor RsiW